VKVWTIESSQFDAGTHRWSEISASGSAMSFREICAAWKSDESFRAYWVASLRGVPFEAYCWECPPVNDRNRSRPFECVFVSSPSLARMHPEPGVFAGHFRQDRDVVTFWNLGGDAVLVAPCPAGASDFTHLAQFARAASMAQQGAFWQAVGDAVDARLGSRPMWLSTAGHGVGWLHVRLDSRPKYYRHRAYTRA
jgi:hypothetical protein